MFGQLFEAMEGIGGWGVALGVIVAAPVLGRVARPVVKEAIKGYLAAVDGIQSVAERAKTDVQAGMTEGRGAGR